MRVAFDLRARTGGWSGLLAQALLAGAIVVLGLWLTHNAATAIQARGLGSGFEFLNRPAGFDIAQSLVPYKATDPHARVFLVGALNTLLVAALGIVGATVLGLVAGVARQSRNFLARSFATAYVEVARNTPLPIQILVWFNLALAAPPPRAAPGVEGLFYLSNRGLYLPRPVLNELGGAALLAALVSLLAGWGLVGAFRRLRAERGRGPAPAWGWALAAVGVAVSLLATGNPAGVEGPSRGAFDFSGGLALSPALTALWTALSVYTGAFIAEIVRGGLNAVSVGQSEAARALGLADGQTLRLVVMPQALRVIVPPLASQYLNLTKNSSLAVIIGYPDLVAVFAGTTLNQTGQAIETLALTMAFYLAVSLSISLFMNLWNARTAAWARR
jgi:general L-amino acid transport system permease protein